MISEPLQQASEGGTLMFLPKRAQRLTKGVWPVLGPRLAGREVRWESQQMVWSRGALLSANCLPKPCYLKILRFCGELYQQLLVPWFQYLRHWALNNTL